ncbi:MAG TPA: hypothetical protein VGS80_16180 [Ktedonobacterales bacterium]|nr:hypothetical protein [Ktedonobacterales bacterium]
MIDDSPLESSGKGMRGRLLGQLPLAILLAERRSRPGSRPGGERHAVFVDVREVSEQAEQQVRSHALQTELSRSARQQQVAEAGEKSRSAV